MTVVVAHIVMNIWEKMIRESLRNSLIEIYLIGKYVDNVKLATFSIPKGYCWLKALKGGS